MEMRGHSLQHLLVLSVSDGTGVFPETNHTYGAIFYPIVVFGNFFLQINTFILISGV